MTDTWTAFLSLTLTPPINCPRQHQPPHWTIQSISSQVFIEYQSIVINLAIGGGEVQRGFRMHFMTLRSSQSIKGVKTHQKIKNDLLFNRSMPKTSRIQKWGEVVRKAPGERDFNWCLEDRKYFESRSKGKTLLCVSFPFTLLSNYFWYQMWGLSTHLASPPCHLGIPQFNSILTLSSWR